MKSKHEYYVKAIEEMKCEMSLIIQLIKRIEQDEGSFSSDATIKLHELLNKRYYELLELRQFFRNRMDDI